MVLAMARAYRALRDRPVRVLEIDTPATQGATRQALDRAGIDASHVPWAETDFGQTTLRNARPAHEHSRAVHGPGRHYPSAACSTATCIAERWSGIRAGSAIVGGGRDSNTDPRQSGYA